MSGTLNNKSQVLHVGDKLSNRTAQLLRVGWKLRCVTVAVTKNEAKAYHPCTACCGSFVRHAPDWPRKADDSSEPEGGDRDFQARPRHGPNNDHAAHSATNHEATHHRHFTEHTANSFSREHESQMVLETFNVPATHVAIHAGLSLLLLATHNGWQGSGCPKQRPRRCAARSAAPVVAT